MFWWLYHHGTRWEEPVFTGDDLNEFILVHSGTGNIDGGYGRDFLLLEGDADDYRFTDEGSAVRVERLNGIPLSVLVTDVERVLFVRPEELRPFGSSGDIYKLSSLVIEAEAPNTPPDAVDDGGFSATVGETLSIPVSALLANDTDREGDTLSIVALEDVRNGTAVLDGDFIRLTAAAAGLVTFAYVVSDGIASDRATVSVEITEPQNTAPEATDDSGYTVEAGAIVEIPVSELISNDSDPDADPLTISDVHGATNGTAVLDGDIIRFSAGEEGPGGFTYTVTDGELTDTALVSVDIGTTHDQSQEGGTTSPTQSGEPQPTTTASHDNMDAAAMGMEPAMMAEHVAVLELVSDAKATHVAVNSGDWFDPATWADGVVPGEGAAVVISEGVSVTYGGVSNAALATLRVDGTLSFATNTNSRIEVETFVVNAMGRLEAGTLESPLSPAFNIDIVIDTSTGPIDRTEDPTQIGRGLVALGEVEMHGAEKTVYTTVEIDAMQGDTSLTLSEAPGGWQVGDTIVLTGTHYIEVNHGYQGSQDEEFTIVAIDGNVITLDHEIQFDHDTPRDDLKAYVANYTRNISIETENPDGLPANERGHVMFMHSDAVDVRFVEFHELGRTDKSIPIDNYLRDYSQKGAPYLLDENGELQEGAQDNIVARYAVHVHRSGADDGSGDPAYFYGNAVFGSPGWGYVNHDSHVVFEQNAAYNVTGSAFVTETGNEIGAIIGNISIRNDGNVGDTLRTGVKDGKSTFDLGFGGHGFWLQGRIVAVEDNIAVGAAESAFEYFHRGKPTGSDWEDWYIPAELLAHEAIASGETEVGVNIAPIISFSGNEAFASAIGLEVVKNNPKQGHDMGTKMDSFTAWEVEVGVALEYTAHYTLTDFDLVGAPGTEFSKGIILKQESMNVYIVNANVNGFSDNYYVQNPYNTNNPLFGLDNDGYFFINDMIMTRAEYELARIDDPSLPEDMNAYYKDLIFNWAYPEDFDPNTPGLENPITITFLNPADINLDAPVTFELAESSDLVASYGGESWVSYVRIEGVKSDSLGEVSLPNAIESYNLTLYGVQNTLDSNGWYQAADGTRFTVFEFYVFDRLTGASTKTYIPIVLEGGWNYANSQYKGEAEISESGGLAIRSDGGTHADYSEQVIDAHEELPVDPIEEPADSQPEDDSAALGSDDDWAVIRMWADAHNGDPIFDSDFLA